jgi:hypothetical protein
VIGLLNDNPVGKALVGVSAAVLVVLLLLAVAWVLPPAGADLDAGEGGPEVRSDVPQLEEPKPLEQYAEIINRPVFNESRQPVIGGEIPDGEDEELAGEEDVEAPDVELAGVVITPDLRVATLRVKGEEASLLALEGQPLEGDFGSWRVSRVEPRSAVLESASGDQVRLELQIHDAMIDEPPKPRPAAPPPEQAGSEQVQDDAPMSRAEEIRQRIAERREELRRQQEEADQPAEQATPNYRQAIEALMKGRQQDTQEQDESEQ